MNYLFKKKNPAKKKPVISIGGSLAFKKCARCKLKLEWIAARLYRHEVSIELCESCAVLFSEGYNKFLKKFLSSYKEGNQLSTKVESFFTPNQKGGDLC